MPTHPSFRSRLQKVFTLLATRGLTLGLQLGLQIIVARLFGAGATGALQLFTTLTTTTGEICVVGVPANNMRNCAKYREQNSRSLMAYLKKGSLRVAQCALAASAVLIAIGQFTSVDWPFSVLSLVAAVFAYTQMRCLGEALKALDRAQIAVFIEGAIVPFFVLSTTGIYWLATSQPSVKTLILLNSGGFYLALAGLCWVLIKTLNRKQNPRAENFAFSPFNQWQSLWLSGLLGIIYGQFALILLPFFTTLDELGTSSAALRFIAIATTFLMILAAIYAPKFSQQDRKPAALKQTLWQTQYLSIAVFAPFALIFLVFPKTTLGLFGAEFVNAAPLLQMLTIAQLINAATGIPGVALKMLGKANIEQNILVICLAAATLSALVFGNRYGAIGVISVFCLLICAKNIVSYCFVLKQFRVISQHLTPNDSTAKVTS